MNGSMPEKSTMSSKYRSVWARLRPRIEALR
jgi:hypothetical protein